MKDLFKLNCGDKVRDKVTGATGAICIRMQCLSGNIRYAVRPTAPKDGRPADFFWIDEDALTVTKKATGKQPERLFAFKLGDEVKDKWSDLRGVVSSRQDHQYGCLRYEVQPRGIVEGKLAQGYLLDEGALTLMNAAPKFAQPTSTPGAEYGSSSPERGSEVR